MFVFNTVTGHMKNNKLFHNDKNPLVIEKSKMINIEKINVYGSINEEIQTIKYTDIPSIQMDKETKIKYIIRIQRYCRLPYQQKLIKCLSIIEILNLNPTIMRDCNFACHKTSKQFPPHKNENKFIYGKMVEMSINEALNKIGLKCIDLDKSHKTGSEYKNDISILNLKFSIKAKLNKGGSVILINKKSNNVKHNISFRRVL